MRSAASNWKQRCTSWAPAMVASRIAWPAVAHPRLQCTPMYRRPDPVDRAHRLLAALGWSYGDMCHWQAGLKVWQVYALVAGRWVNREMVEDGHAWHYKHYSRSADLARAESRGAAGESRAVVKSRRRGALGVPQTGAGKAGPRLGLPVWFLGRLRDWAGIVPPEQQLRPDDWGQPHRLPRRDGPRAKYGSAGRHWPRRPHRLARVAAPLKRPSRPR